MPLTSTVRIRFLLDSEVAIGSGKAVLLDAIRQTGSIAAAAKSLDMSYRRAWQLVGTMNTCFEKPLVQATKGGAGGGGAQITETGLVVLAEFVALQHEVESLIAARKPALQRLLRRAHSPSGASR